MSLFQFLKSRTFFIQLGIAIVSIVVLCVLLLYFLDFKTNHGEEIPVPDLNKMQISIATEKLNEIDLDLIVLDTVDFNPKMPPYSIVQQDPNNNTTVKSGRKIYVKINAGGYSDVKIPIYKDKTYRQLSANIKILGLVEGTTTYKPNIAKDVVLGITQNGKMLKAGQVVKKNSKVDFILGDGKEVFDGMQFQEHFSPDETGTINEDSQNTDDTE